MLHKQHPYNFLMKCPLVEACSCIYCGSVGSQWRDSSQISLPLQKASGVALQRWRKRLSTSQTLSGCEESASASGNCVSNTIATGWSEDLHLRRPGTQGCYREVLGWEMVERWRQFAAVHSGPSVLACASCGISLVNDLTIKTS